MENKENADLIAVLFVISFYVITFLARNNKSPKNRFPTDR
jgi:hypothetical protein